MGYLRLRLASIAVAAALPAGAAEYVILTTGYRLLADRWVLEGEKVLLYQGQGVTELPGHLVEGFEPAAEPPEAPAAAEAPAPAAPPAPAPDPENLLREAALRYGLPLAFIRSVALAESALNPDAVSPKGALGLMQLMPETAAALDADPHDTGQNVDAGVRYLRDLLLKYRDHPDQVYRALAAYNAGPGAVDRYGGVPPYRETVAYIERVLRRYLRDSRQ